MLAYGVVLGEEWEHGSGRAMQTLLFHVPAFNLGILSGAAGVMGIVCIAACLVPSYRAARTSPVEALREVSTDPPGNNHRLHLAAAVKWRVAQIKLRRNQKMKLPTSRET